MEKDSKESQLIKRIEDLEKELNSIKYKVMQIPQALSGNSWSVQEIKWELERIGLKV
jgi:uncharacterized protein (UPF0335 family)